jgi:hypothetical protein
VSEQGGQRRRGSDQGGQERRRSVLHAEKYDLESLMKIVEEERAYDESVKARVTQEDIRKLIEKKRKRRK